MTDQQQQPQAEQQAAPPKPARASLGQLVTARKQEIASIANDIKQVTAIPNFADKFIRTAQLAVTMNPDIAKCDKLTVLNACMKAAGDGLVLDGREAALVTFNVKQKDGSYKPTAQYMPMLTGIIKRVRNSGEISKINAYIVRQNDKFKIKLGLDPNIEHEPNYDNPGKPIGAYAIARFKDGLDDFEYMPFADIEAIRNRSRSPEKGPWKSDWEEMAKKTVMRRLAKRLPMSSELIDMVRRVDEAYDLNAPEPETTIDEETGEITETPAPKKPRGRAAAKLNEQAAAADTQPQGEVMDAQYEEVDEGPQQEGANPPTAQAATPPPAQQAQASPAGPPPQEEGDLI